jgi:two-component system response regulator ResD
MLKVLIADDDPNVLEIVELYLKQNHMQVMTAATGRQALEAAKAHSPDIVVLDIMMPEMDGLEVCRRLRGTTNLPIIMLSAKDEELDRVLGLEIGADDYMTKPFSPRELIARIKAVLRRTNDGSLPDPGADFAQHARSGAGFADRYDYGDLSLDVPRRELTVRGEAVPLRPKEFDLILLFVRNPGIVLHREQILQQVWGYDYFGDMRTVDVHIKKLRQKLSPFGLDCIQTVWGVGYRFQTNGTVTPP